MSAYFKYLMRTRYFRILLTAYAFFVFFGVMPKAPPRGRFQSVTEHLFLTVGNSLGGFVVLGVIAVAVCAAWAAVAKTRGLKPPAQPVPDETSDGGPL
ncbi:MAG: hypothetical protein IT566_17395 [Rhodospirillaceae bacterium]|nr:hypothetical protein [Rhodospirillaceae bacterium]